MKKNWIKYVVLAVIGAIIAGVVWLFKRKK